VMGRYDGYKNILAERRGRVLTLTLNDRRCSAR